ncbi:MAG: hypothetical protein H6Q32_546 [Bacteroidetes bacterium]|nr:hypothetical protein [Bacteroidota bacterium]
MIIVPVTGSTLDLARQQVQLSGRFADMLELRLDLIGLETGKSILRKSRKPCIATCRPAREGGKYDGDEKGRLQILTEAVRSGAAYVDIERDAVKDLRARLEAEHLRAKLIVSRHIFDGGMPAIRKEYRNLRSAGADVVKFASMASDAWQLSGVREFLRLAMADRQKAIALAMGEAGEASRILYKVFGGWATYGAPEVGDPSAPGQLTARVLRTVFHAHERTRRTRIFGLVGNPVGQSKGIYIHNPLYLAAGYDGIYGRFPISDLGLFMKHVGPLLTGCSVTLPHKTAMMRYCSSPTAGASAIGAVNTIVRRHGGWHGANTDANAALDAIERRRHVRGKRVVIMGAGGAARAIAVEAKRRGAEVVIANRTAANARTMAAEAGVEWTSLNNAPDLLPEILVNTTPVGMWPDVHSTPIATIPESVQLAFDAIYNPPVTRFLALAKERNIHVVTGAEMYARQAVEQIHILTGLRVTASKVNKLFNAASALRPQAPTAEPEAQPAVSNIPTASNTGLPGAIPAAHASDDANSEETQSKS